MKFAVAALAASVAAAAYCGGSPSPDAKPNAYPISTTAPTFIKSVKNGKLYQAGAPGFEFNVAHIWGSAYDLGYAHGQLFQGVAANVSNEVWAYMEEQVTSNLQFLPAWLADLIANYGLEVALDLLADLERPSTPTHFFDELQGLADATGVDYKQLLRIHLIGELTQGDCSMYGAWGPATLGGKTLSLRALDWDTDIPAVQHPTVFVYHPTDGHAFANVGFVGWIGALSGQSSTQMSIHEIGVSFPDNTFGNESFAGIPFTFLLRDILQFDNTYNDTINRIKGANRTCDLILGVGDGKAGTFRGFQYSASVANVFDDTNQMPLASWHPRIPNVVFWGMDWDCISYNQAMATQLSLYVYNGTLTPQATISNVIPIVQTGDVHAVIYDLTDQQMYVSFYATNASTVQEPKNAYDRAFTQLDMPALFAEQPPTVA